MSEANIGKIIQVIGPVLDVEFDPEKLPDIYNALSVKSSQDGQEINLIAEVQSLSPTSDDAIWPGACELISARRSPGRIADAHQTRQQRTQRVGFGLAV